MSFKKLKYLVASLLILSLLIAPAAAHGVYMSWTPIGNQVQIHAYYQGNDPMANCDITVETIDSAGNAAAYITDKTDANGNYTFDVKSGITSYRIKVVEGEHAISKKIDVASGSGGVESEVGWWGKLMGTEGPSLFTIGAGLGWIVGIAGIIMYLQARKLKNS
ncbi:hypothetical protein MmiAt1_11860 [Methanimicrococcus sp. At1]|uniref:Carboxypeptidase regulatory-like domain-containing protein n=1 Tax=Methanimicrococcus hacksteinii TaxID=3028293 RepID=A0ABU3VRS5_9EURY|nr:hypothetical protein [Methanimicrococcus sp. At1]MDV0445600.1 hypothetical protein [Methanimicrococcus sp. At1]